MIVPAPDASVFFHKPDYASKPKRQAFGQSIGFRQTLIPILLTGGFIMVVLGLLHFLWSGEGNPLAELPMWLLGGAVPVRLRAVGIGRGKHVERQSRP